MPHLPNFSATASLIADPTRAIMLTTLLDGRALPAGELAYASGVHSITFDFISSSHLSKLLAGGLISVETEGRHRYFRLAGSHVAYVLEQLASIRPEVPIRRKVLSPQGRQLRFCRYCYDHLAGQIGVAITQALQKRGYILPAANKQYDITPVGVEWFGSVGLDVRALTPTQHGLARQCLDWTERTHHLAGPLGTRFMDVLCASGWLRRAKDSRVVTVTSNGWAEMRRHLGIDKDSFAGGIGSESYLFSTKE